MVYCKIYYNKALTEAGKILSAVFSIEKINWIRDVRNNKSRLSPAFAFDLSLFNIKKCLVASFC